MYRDGKCNVSLLNMNVLYCKVHSTGHDRLNIAKETECSPSNGVFIEICYLI